MAYTFTESWRADEIAPYLAAIDGNSDGAPSTLVVDPAWRRRGIGGLLARSVEAWALRLGVP